MISKAVRTQMARTRTQILLLPSANEVCEGYVFTGVCLSAGRGSSAYRGLHPWGGLYPGQGLHSGGSASGGFCIRGERGSVSGGFCIHRTGVCIQGEACIQVGQNLPLPHRILRDTVNERAVRILLECILV